MSTHKLSAPPPMSTPDANGEHAFALHEVSNALTVVLGWLDLGARAESEEELRHAMRVAREHAKRGQVLARRAIGADVESSRGGRSASEIVEFVAVSLQPTAMEQGVAVAWQTEPETDAAVNDETCLVQVLTNLLLNAIQFSPPQSKIHLHVTRRGDDLGFCVSDEGPGVAPAQRELLFSKNATTRSGGAGLGLAHSRALARKRGGDLRLVPSPVGASFEVSWPIARPISFRPSCAPGARNVLSGARILLIEDDLAVASLIELSFQARGAEVIAVHDATQLASLLRGRPVLDVVLMDLSPVEHCLQQCLDEIDALSQSAPILLMSGQPSGVPSGGEGRFASWVRKPFDMEQLIESVSELLAPHS